MFHPHSNYVWPELLSKRVLVPLLLLVLLLLTSQFSASDVVSA